ncbi:MAG: aminomethyl-transferring glycine dehydrogenase [Chlorobi bacterium]|nr:aminomethyl-transferring glycine dehydrogenase [Chlorobiota bacterium]
MGVYGNDEKEMLDAIGVESTDELIEKTIPKKIRLQKELNLGKPLSEEEMLKGIKELADKNKVYRTFIGMGYYGTVTPSVIKRNVLENPGWYTSYTPYQAEISQGRLEALLNYQTMIADLTGLPLTNASLLDEATAAAEIMTMFRNLRKGDKKQSNVFLVDKNVFPQTIEVIKTRAGAQKIKVVVDDVSEEKLNDDVYAILVQFPGADGEVKNFEKLFAAAKEKNIFVGTAADLISLVIFTPPGEIGADAVVGSTQRFGVPMGYGGPHAAYLATREEYKRQAPGRIIGVSIDRSGRPAFRMALQTREQHIKREKATSNICTAQVLLAVMAGMYAVYHGPEKIKHIAKRIYNLSHLLAEGLKSIGVKPINESFFDTIVLRFDSAESVEKIKTEAEKNKINFRYSDNNEIGISTDEITTFNDITDIINIFASSLGKDFSIDTLNEIAEKKVFEIPSEFIRKSAFMTHPVFNSYHTETEMMRYVKRLENKDISLVHSMIPLGSCTMKLNAATEMYGISNEGFANLHPFIPKEQANGYAEMIAELENVLCKITGFAAFTFQPNSGAQGEFTGLMTIMKYHQSHGEENRTVVLIPSSAHGTNPASAVMAGAKVVIVKCDERGNIDVEDLRTKAEENKENLSALMVTYPSTHGVFEEAIKEMCEIIHVNGGLVYMDGANMNAQIGLTNPAEIGADVCHLNLHKTFAIPHGGGGPGVGPVGVVQKLIPFLPSHPLDVNEDENSLGAVSASNFGSASILPISYAYIKMMGGEGLKRATITAILNANYIKAKLEPYYKVVYKGEKGFVGHELIFDLHEFKASAGVSEEDIAKRLMDYGYHAPTVSFPVHGTFMIEPTESESKAELDKFCAAMISIRKEIDEIIEGKLSREDNPLVNAPHTAREITGAWEHTYSREKAVFPNENVRENKIWPASARIDNAYGDRNLVCSCLPVEAYQNEGE